MTLSADRIIAALLKLTQHERKLLIAGKLEDLGKLEQTKVALLARLEALNNQADPAALTGLRKAAAENHHLYQAAILGVRRVRDQVAGLIKSGGAEFQTYAPDGGRQTLAKGKSRIERRA